MVRQFIRDSQRAIPLPGGAVHEWQLGKNASTALDSLVKLIYHLAMGSKHRHTVNLSWKIHRILNKYERLESTAIQVTPEKVITHRELHAIQAIGEIENINITGLGTHFGVTKSAASQLISKLVQKGMVAKEQSPRSGKELNLALTDLGWQAYELHEKYHSRNIRKIAERLSGFSVTQITTTSSILDVIESVMDKRLSDE